MKHEERGVARSRLSLGGTSGCLPLGHLSVTPQAPRPLGSSAALPAAGTGMARQ